MSSSRTLSKETPCDEQKLSFLARFLGEYLYLRKQLSQEGNSSTSANCADNPYGQDLWNMGKLFGINMAEPGKLAAPSATSFYQEIRAWNKASECDVAVRGRQEDKQLDLLGIINHKPKQGLDGE